MANTREREDLYLHTSKWWGNTRVTSVGWLLNELLTQRSIEKRPDFTHTHTQFWHFSIEMFFAYILTVQIECDGNSQAKELLLSSIQKWRMCWKKPRDREQSTQSRGIAISKVKLTRTNTATMPERENGQTEFCWPRVKQNGGKGLRN
jgi:hypothetical protein